MPGSVQIRTDVPLYRIWRNGKLEKEVDDIRPYFDDMMVSFLLGCSFGMEGALQQAGLEVF